MDQRDLLFSDDELEELGVAIARPPAEPVLLPMTPVVAGGLGVEMDPAGPASPAPRTTTPETTLRAAELPGGAYGSLAVAPLVTLADEAHGVPEKGEANDELVVPALEPLPPAPPLTQLTPLPASAEQEDLVPFPAADLETGPPAPQTATAPAADLHTRSTEPALPVTNAEPMAELPALHAADRDTAEPDSARLFEPEPECDEAVAEAPSAPAEDRAAAEDPADPADDGATLEARATTLHDPDDGATDAPAAPSAAQQWSDDEPLFLATTLELAPYAPTIEQPPFLLPAEPPGEPLSVVEAPLPAAVPAPLTASEAQAAPTPILEPDLVDPAQLAGPDLLAGLDLEEERRASQPALEVDLETVLDEDDQLPLTPEEMAEVQAEPPGSLLPPPPPPRALPPPPPPQPQRARPAAEHRPDPQQVEGHATPMPGRSDPWYVRLFDGGYLEMVRRRPAAAVRRQVDFLLQQLDLTEGGTILDLGCGDGAHAISFAQQGLRVTGLDLSEPLVEYARHQAELLGVSGAQFVRADMRGLESEEQFDAIVSLNTSFGYFDDTSNVKVLKAVVAALRPGGRFVLEVLNRDGAMQEQPVRSWYQSGSLIVLEEGHFDFLRSQLVVHRQLAFPDGRQQEDELRIRLYSLHELSNLLRILGLDILHVFGSPHSPLPFFGASTRTLLLIAEKS